MIKKIDLYEMNLPFKTSEEFSLHRVQFEDLNPKNGYINGTKAKEYFTKSKLSNVILAQIWNLADVVFYFVPMHKTN